MEVKVWDIIQKYRSSGNATKWNDIDYMIEYVKSVDFSMRRQKHALIETLVDAVVRKMTLDLPAISSSDSDEELEAERLIQIGDQNSLNRMLLKSYAATSKPENIEVIETPVKDLDSIQADIPVDGEITPLKPTISDSNKISTKSKRSTGDINASSGNDKKKRKLLSDYAPPSSRYSDFGGISSCISEIRELIEAPLKHPEIYSHLKISPPRGILFHGPPGCGKTMLAKAIGGELNVPFMHISAPSVVSGMSGESEKKVREIFNEAKELAPCILFFDEIDAITPKRETVSKDMERRIVAQMLTCMDELSSEQTERPVIIIGATNRPDALDNALRRAGRFDREISLGIPNEQAREEILKVLTVYLKLSENLDFKDLAKITPGYVGADLHSLVSAAGVFAIRRIFQDLTISAMDTSELENTKDFVAKFLTLYPDRLSEDQLKEISITMDDFREGLKKVQPSSKREGFATVPGVSWSQIGALAAVREELRMSIVEPIRNPALFAKAGISSPSGVLLWGPPGCGKTLLAKAIANETHCNFISVKGPELLNKYVGESEKGVRQLFARARASSPCVIFFDELDALCPKRGGSSDSSTSERVVNQLLTELDGLEGRKEVYIIAATNRPDIIDSAILRPGRLDKLVYVKLPTPEERFEILKTLTAKVPISPAVDLKQVAENSLCDRFSGADLSALVKEAGMSALKFHIKTDTLGEIDNLLINSDNFDEALKSVRPSVSERDLKNYEDINRKLH